MRIAADAVHIMAELSVLTEKLNVQMEPRFLINAQKKGAINAAIRREKPMEAPIKTGRSWTFPVSRNSTSGNFDTCIIVCVPLFTLLIILDSFLQSYLTKAIKDGCQSGLPDLVRTFVGSLSTHTHQGIDWVLFGGY